MASDLRPPTAAGPVVRRARLADAAAFAAILGDPYVVPGLLQMPWTSEDVWRERLAGVSRPDADALVLAAELDGVVVGQAGVHPEARLRRRHAACIGIAVAPHAQRRGVGRALLQALCDWADRWAQVHRLELTVFHDNLGAVALYESMGFRVEGRLRGWALRDGVHCDVLSMARLHPDFEARLARTG